MRPLALGFVKQNSGGDGGVERFDAAGGDADGDGGFAEARRDAAAFAADDDGASALELGLRDGARSARKSRVQSYVFLFQSRGEELCSIPEATGSRKVEPAEARRHLGLIRIDRAFEEGGSGGSEGFGGADDGAGVAGVLHTVEHDHQRLAADQLVERPGGRADEGDDALRGLGGGEVLRRFCPLTATTRVLLEAAHVSRRRWPGRTRRR